MRSLDVNVVLIYLHVSLWFFYTLHTYVHIQSLSGKLAIVILATLVFLHYNIYKNRVKLGFLKLATSTTENGEN